MKTQTGVIIALTVLMGLILAACSQFSPQAQPTEVGTANIVRMAFPSSMDIGDIAALLTFERMEGDGIVVVPTFFAQSEVALAAVAQGDADMGAEGAATATLAAVQKGAPLMVVMLPIANEWSVMAVNDITSCENIDGRRVAIHSEGAVSTGMLKAWIDSTCPDVEPNYLVIPGSENRATALLAGEIDVTPAELSDSVRIITSRPGEFHRIANFAVDLPKLMTSGTYVGRDFAQEHPEVIESYIRNRLEVHRRINDNPDWFIEQVPRFLEVEEDLLPDIVDALVSINYFPINGGLTTDRANFTIDFFTDAGAVEPGLKAEQVYELSYLDAVLDEMGRR